MGSAYRAMLDAHGITLKKLLNTAEGAENIKEKTALSSLHRVTRWVDGLVKLTALIHLRSLR